MKNIKNLSRRALSLFLSLVMCLGLVNLTAFAAEGNCPQIDENGNHKKEYLITMEPTCTEKGSAQWWCSSCKTVFENVEVPAKGHRTEIIVDNEPTCTEKGNEHEKCTVCGAIVENKEIPELGHDWDDGTVTKQATATEAGEITYTCRRDQTHKKTDLIPMLENSCKHEKGNKVEDTLTINPTCTEKGYEYYVCVDCNDVVDKKEIPAKGHQTEIIVDNEPTCTEKGNEHEVCTVCGVTVENKENPALGHEWGEWKIVKAATCTEEGEQKRECKREGCNASEDEVISALGHELEPVLVGATCTDEGKTGVKCARPGCDYSDVVPAASIGHDWKTIAQVEGDHENHKVICGNDASHTKDEPHSWSDWEVIKEATVDEEGLQSRKCEDCGYTESQVIARLTGDNNNNSGNENGDNNNSDTSNGKDDQDIPDTRPPQGGGDENTTPPTVDVEDEQPPLAENPEGNDPIDSAPVEADIPDEQPPLVDWPVDIPDEQPPLAVIPEGEIPVDIPENDTPLAAGPEIDVLDEVVPMVGVPQTGDISLTWYAVAAMSVCGLAVLTLKKREDEEN